MASFSFFNASVLSLAQVSVSFPMTMLISLFHIEVANTFGQKRDGLGVVLDDLDRMIVDLCKPGEQSDRRDGESHATPFPLCV